MNAIFCRRLAVAGMALSLCTGDASQLQSPQNADQVLEAAVITKFSPLIYPPLAHQTGISGEVVIKLDVRPDGSVASATVISGHPILSPVALKSALESQFACPDCGQEVHWYRLVYKFELPPAIGCAAVEDKSSASQEQAYPRATQSRGQVLIVLGRIKICDPVTTIKYARVRSVRCLYLWKCGRRY
jgi:TonB family protein